MNKWCGRNKLDKCFPQKNSQYNALLTGGPRPMENYRPDHENRRIADRRKRRIPPFQFLLFGGRRKTVRRSDPQPRIIIMDHYSERLFTVIVAILMLSLIDAMMTLHLISNGATELNPVMAYFLGKGPVIFISAKYCITAVSVTILVLVKFSLIPFFRFHARNLFIFAFSAFLMVIIWEVALVYRVFS